MKLLDRISHYVSDDNAADEDPVSSAVASISRVLELGGTYNFSGFKLRNCSILSLLLLLTTLGSFVYVGQVSQWVHLASQWPNQFKIIQALDCIVTTWIPLSELAFIWIHKSTLKEMFMMTSDGFASLPVGSPSYQALRATLRKARLLNNVVTISFLTTHLLFVALPLLFGVIMGKKYFPEVPGEFVGLKPRDNSPNYELSYIFITIGTMFSAINVTGYTNIFVTFMAHILGHMYGIIDTLKWLRDQLEQYEEKRSDSEQVNSLEMDTVTVDTLKFCVQRHQYIIAYHEKFANMYTVIFGFHFLLMTIILVTTVETMNDWGLINTAITASVSFMPLIMYCFGGELVISTCSELAYATYDCSWERMRRSEARTALFMLSAAQRPLNFMAANLFPLDVETFGTVMQTVYKVYAVLR